MKIANNFEFFCFMKEILVAAKKAGYVHQPEHDRYICDEVSISFSKFNGYKEIVALDIEFDLTAHDVLKSGVATFETSDGCRVLKGENIVFVTADKFFDPNTLIAYGEFERI